MVYCRKTWLTVQTQPNAFNNFLSLCLQITKRKHIFTAFNQIFFCKHYSQVTKLEYASMIFYISVGRRFDILNITFTNNINIINDCIEFSLMILN